MAYIGFSKQLITLKYIAVIEPLIQREKIYRGGHNKNQNCDRF